jgi:uncharacterized membrane protein YphA (DoxX/SURF4 family)
VVAQAVSAIALALLAASGVSKVIEPDPTVGALRAMGLPGRSLTARFLGGAEIVAAAVGLASGGPWIVAAATLYLSFLVFTYLAIRRESPLQSCGCFGREDTPPTWIHVGFNGLALVALGYLSLVNRSPVPWQLPAPEVVSYLAFTVIGAYLAYLLLTRLPQTLQMARAR